MLNKKMTKIVSLVLALLMLVMSGCTPAVQDPSTPSESSSDLPSPSSPGESNPEPDPEPMFINLFDKADSDYGYINSDGTEEVDGKYLTSKYIDVKPGDKIYLGPCDPELRYQICGYNLNDRMIDKKSGDTLTEEALFPNGYAIYSYTVPEKVYYIRVTAPSKYSDLYLACREEITLEKFKEFWGREATFRFFERLNDEGYIDYKKEIFADTKALFLGDSICSANHDYPYHGWAGRIESSTGMDCINAGSSGASLSTARGTNRVINWYNLSKGNRYGYIIMHGGVNDAWDSVAVGEMSGSFELSSFDTTTYAGGLEELFYHVTKDNPDAKLGYIINFATPSHTAGRTKDMTEYYEMGKKICEKWGIPYLNMYEDQDLSKELKVTSKTHLSDYLHPLPSGYDILYRYIMYWMETLPAHSALPEGYELETIPTDLVK